MDVGPSSQDRQSSIYRAKNAGDYFIRAICNKDGKMHLSFFDNIKGIAYENIDWVVDDGVDRNAISKKFKDLVKTNVLPWDIAFPKPKPETASVTTDTCRVGSPADLKRLCDDVMGVGAVVPGRDESRWPFIDEEPKTKKVRRRSQVAA